MVGATKSFIRKPFIRRSMLLGLIGGVLAVIALLVVLLNLSTAYPGLDIFNQMELTIIVLVAVLGMGIVITWISTYFATQRFLNLRTDDLY